MALIEDRGWRIEDREEEENYPLFSILLT